MACPFCGVSLPSGLQSCPDCGNALNDTLRETSIPTRHKTPDDTGSPPVQPLHVQTHVSGFRILRTIGRGATGAVYEAYQESMHRKVALKVLESGVETSAARDARFEREAWIGGRLSHPNIVKVYGRGADGTKRWIAMELIQGGSLHQAIHEVRQLRSKHAEAEPENYGRHIRRMVHLFVEVASALSNVHAQGVVHRDIKPLNLLLDREGDRLVLTDFGLARDPEESNLTRRGDFMGTIRYMSPEQLLAHRAKVDHRSDIWSLGVSLYEAVTLELPYEAQTEEGYIGAVSMKDPIPARAWNRGVPRDLETILMKCLERDPERRYASALELRDDLIRFLEDRPVEARRPSLLLKAARLAKRRRSLLGSAAAAGLLAAIAISMLAQHVQDRRQMQRIRWTLEQVVEKGVDPSNLQPDWPKLLDRMIHEVNRHPKGELALLAARASGNARVRVSSFGLLKDPPGVEVRFGGSFYPGTAVHFLTDLEASIDGEGWRPIGGCGYGFEGRIWRGSLDIFTGRSIRKPGPHRLDVRATYTIADSGKVHLPGFSMLGDESIASAMDPEELKSSVTFQERRIVGTYNVNLFERYPDSFPRALTLAEVSRPLDSWFQLDSARIVRDRPDLGGKNLVLGLMLFGRMDPETPAPIAADAEVRLSGASQEILKCAIALGEGGIDVGKYGCSFSVRGGMIVSAYVPRMIYGASPWLVKSSASVDASLKDGLYRGEMRLSPSRDFALWTQRLDRYVGDSLSIPLQIRIVTGIESWGGTEEKGVTVWPRELDMAQEKYAARPAQETCASYAVELLLAGENVEALKKAVEAASLQASASGNYNLACYWALAGDAEKAIRLLERAQRLGYRSDHVGDEVDLASIRADPRFASIVEAMRPTAIGVLHAKGTRRLYQ